ncbi:MAG: histidine phosphatase family protein [Acidimicrobiales bacterium]
MELVLIRHGQPAWAREGRSVDDPGLTELGAAQAARAAERLIGTRVDRLLVSPLRRARETVAPIADALGLEPEIHGWLAEIGNPTWEGTPTEEVERLFRESRGRSIDEQWEGLPGGESFRAFHDRVTSGLRGFLDEAGAVQLTDDPPQWRLVDPDRRFVLVAHAGTNAAAIGHLLGVRPVPWEWERFVSFHASVSVLQPLEIADGWSFSLLRFSDTSHLPDDHQTR